EHLRLYYWGEGAENDDYAAARNAQLEAWTTVFKEDISMVEGMQRGRASPACIGGVFSPVQDVATHHFHRWMARQLLLATTSSSTASETTPPVVSVLS